MNIWCTIKNTIFDSNVRINYIMLYNDIYEHDQISLILISSSFHSYRVESIKTMIHDISI